MGRDQLDERASPRDGIAAGGVVEGGDELGRLGRQDGLGDTGPAESDVVSAHLRYAHDAEVVGDLGADPIAGEDGDLVTGTKDALLGGDSQGVGYDRRRARKSDPNDRSDDGIGRRH